MSADEAAAYHGPQVAALAESGADRVTAVTTLDAAEGIGVVRAAASARIPAAVSFVVGANGRLADGSSVAEAIAAVDTATAAVALGFLINCAHPDEVLPGLEECAGTAELDRIIGFRLNAARHDDGGPGDDPVRFAEAELQLTRLAPNACTLGGCCGTDGSHIIAIADALEHMRAVQADTRSGTR